MLHLKLESIVIVLVVFSILLCAAVGESNLGFAKTPSVQETSTSATIPSHSTVEALNNSSEEVNVNAIRSSEPAPMGIADYGVGLNSAYHYSTSSFLGIAHILSLTTYASSSMGGSAMSFQLNVVLQFSTQGGQQRVYWLQDVAAYDTNTKKVYFEDNVWNQSSMTAEMSASGISGNGKVYTFTNGGYTSSYYAVGTTYYNLPLPALIEFEITSSINSQNEPEVTFAYNYGSGMQTYDTVTFSALTSSSKDNGLVVDGTQYNPYGTYYDAELVMGGESSGYNTTDVQSDVALQLQYWNGHNYQEITNAYNFGSNTLEGISNVNPQSYYYPINGSLEAQISSGAGTLGDLYYQSQIGIVNIESSLTSGVLYVENSSSTSGLGGTGYSFTGGDANVTLNPGTYSFYVYTSGGSPIGHVTTSVRAGQYLSMFVASIPVIQLTLSYSVLGTGNGYSAPTFSYIANGIQRTATLTNSPTIYYLDAGTAWSLTNPLSGSTSTERWETNQTTSGSAVSAATVNFVFYHQFLVSFGYSVVGSGSGYTEPTVTTVEFGSKTSETIGLKVWVDAVSQYYFTNPLAGSTQMERWDANTSTGVIPSPTTVSIQYYHQFVVSAGFTIANGGVPPTGPTFTSASFGTTYSSTLTTTPTSFWQDSGSNYNLSSVISGSKERWITNSSAAGAVTSQLSLNFVYDHQYYVVMQTPEEAGGTVNPSSEWVNAGNNVSISNTAVQGWKFEFWTGTGTGSYSGTENSTIIKVEAPISENATFYVGLTIVTSGSGSVSYTYGNSGSVQVTSHANIYVPPGTVVTLNASPSLFLYKLNSWSGAVTGASQTSITVSSPSTAEAQFGYNFITIGGIVAILAFALIGIAAAMTRRKPRTM